MKTLRHASRLSLLFFAGIAATFGCSSSGGSAAAGSTDCASLGACCVGVGSAATVSSCKSVVATGDEATCTSTLIAYTETGACAVASGPVDAGHGLGFDARPSCEATATCTTTKDASHMPGFDTGTTAPVDAGFIADGEMADVEPEAAADDTGGGCTGDEVSCDGVCTDTMTDPDNCGSCGNQCTGGGTCATSMCSSSVDGCGHSPCVTGAPLSDTCNPYNDNTTQAVCDCLGDTACCTTSWDSQCVAEAEEYCTDLAGGCEDPECPGS